MSKIIKNLLQTEVLLRSRPIVLFYRSHKRENKNGFAPVYCRITVHGKRHDFSTGIFVLRDEFRNGRFVESSPLLIAHQRSIEQLAAKVFIIETDLRTQGRDVTVYSVIKILLEGYRGKPTLFAVIDEFLESQEKLVGTDFKAATQHKKVIYSRHIKSFVNQVLKQPDIGLDEFREPIAEKFYSFLRSDRKYASDSVKKTIGFLKACIRFAVRNDYCQKSYIEHFKIRNYGTQIIAHLSSTQLQDLANKQFASEPLNIARYMFLFQCFTGMAYGDIYRFDYSYLFLDHQGKKWLRFIRQKNRKENSRPSVVVLLPEAELILNRYAGYKREVFKNPGVLPIYAVQAYNRLLKEIAMICGFDVKLSTHVARKTFGTLLANEGVSMQAISKMLGHSKIAITEKHYADVDLRLIRSEMNGISFENLKQSGDNTLIPLQITQ